MLNLRWLFKNPRAAAPPPTAATSGPAPSPRKPKESAADTAARQAAQASARGAALAAENWPGRLQQALGDDAALLQLASTAPGLDTRLAAVQALAGEDALRQAERALRNRDRKLHSLAKSRLETAVSQRTSRAKAEQLLHTTEQLLHDPLLPVNHVVALDRDWQALPAALLEPAQREAFSALRAKLDNAIRERADAEQHLQRWTAQAKRALPDWADRVSAIAAAAPAQPADEASAALAELRSQALSLRAVRPAVVSTDMLDAALVQLLAAADAAQTVVDAPPTVDVEAAEAVAVAPAVAQPAPARERHASPEQRQQLEALLLQADQALADGQVAALQQHLQSADALQAAARGLQWPAALRARQQALRAEQQRLKSWQSWGGTRARDDLINEAEALARSTLPPPAAQPSAEVIDAIDGTETTGSTDGTATAADVTSPATGPATRPAKPQPAPKLNLRAHADTIHGLRMRWKALDKLGEGAHGALWQRFDAALTTAFQPVAAQHAVQQAARQQNLATRQALLDGLDAVALPGVPSADAAEPGINNPPDWRDAARQLDAFQLAWRQLGPLEHTAPADARKLLLQRLQTSSARLEQPLRQARDQATAEREQFIQRALALVPSDSGRLLPSGELQRQLRALQAEWQEHARGLPLPRAIENALWTRFRAATDAVFAQRDAAFAAREAEQAAEVAEREALLERLAALDTQTPVPQIERTLAEVDRAWQQAATHLQRAAGMALEARYRDARSTAAGLAQASVRLRWQSQIDSWTAPLLSTTDDATTDTPTTPSDAATDDLLLQLEIALDLPAAPEWQAARRQLKLRALKEAMEGRSAAAPGAAPAAQWLATLLQKQALSALQRQRLLTLLAALRAAAPGTLGLPVPSA